MPPRKRQQQPEAREHKRKFKRRERFKQYSKNRKPGDVLTRLLFCQRNTISESTYQQVREAFEAELVDTVIVKGKTESVKIYRVLGRRGVPADQIQPLEATLAPAE